MSYATYFGRLARHAGFSVAKGLALPLVRREAVRSGAHELAFPIATYAPWRADPDFQSVYETVRRNTLVDVWRCYELWSLLGELRDVPGAILEVGVWRGGTGALLAARAAGLGIDDRVYLCDTWRGVVKSGDVDRYYYDGKHDDASRTDVSNASLRARPLERGTPGGGLSGRDGGADIGAGDPPLPLRRRRLPVGSGRPRLGLATTAAGRRGCLRRLWIPGLPRSD